MYFLYPCWFLKAQIKILSTTNKSTIAAKPRNFFVRMLFLIEKIGIFSSTINVEKQIIPKIMIEFSQSVFFKLNKYLFKTQYEIIQKSQSKFLKNSVNDPKIVVFILVRIYKKTKRLEIAKHRTEIDFWLYEQRITLKIVSIKKIPKHKNSSSNPIIFKAQSKIQKQYYLHFLVHSTYYLFEFYAIIKLFSTNLPIYFF